MICRWCDKRDGSKRQRRRACPRTGPAEALRPELQAPGEHRKTEDKQCVADNGAGQRRFYDRVQSFAQRQHGNDDLRHVAERRVQQPSDALTCFVSQVLGGSTHDTRQRYDRDRRECENERVRLRRRVADDQGDRHEDQGSIKNVPRLGSQRASTSSGSDLTSSGRTRHLMGVRSRPYSGAFSLLTQSTSISRTGTVRYAAR